MHCSSGHCSAVLDVTVQMLQCNAVLYIKVQVLQCSVQSLRCSVRYFSADVTLQWQGTIIYNGDTAQTPGLPRPLTLVCEKMYHQKMYHPDLALV